MFCFCLLDGIVSGVLLYINMYMLMLVRLNFKIHVNTNTVQVLRNKSTLYRSLEAFFFFFFLSLKKTIMHNTTIIVMKVRRQGRTIVKIRSLLSISWHTSALSKKLKSIHCKKTHCKLQETFLEHFTN